MIYSFILMMILTLILIVIMLSLNFIISKNMKISFNKLSPFECGFNNFTKYQYPFSLNFYLMTILFLMFDIEITIILPFFILFKVSKMKMFLITFIFFMNLMTLSLFYEWNQNILNWKI
uniref:NADH-ubiquinone oxidoreductase chain 3 n=1 Tax=Plectrocnemia sp. 1 YW-2021a TaxID=2823369 RepID=A0A8A9WFR7_9NEOP|nr:NADH dehydrogenase subunit 3 [Plectrocnemia sp. 1 YW-2021a]